VSAFNDAFRQTLIHLASTVPRPFWSGLGCIVGLYQVRPAERRSAAPANRALEITLGVLRALLRSVQERGMEVIGLDAVRDRLKKPRGARFVAFTFDDDYRDNLISYVPPGRSALSAMHDTAPRPGRSGIPLLITPGRERK